MLSVLYERRLLIIPYDAMHVGMVTRAGAVASRSVIVWQCGCGSGWAAGEWHTDVIL